MPTIVGSYVALKFIQLFTKPFNEWPAYKMGLIDDKGQKLRETENTTEEKEFVSWKNLIRKLKIILEKVPLGPFGSKLASFAAAFWLLKEDLDNQGHEGSEIINSLYEQIKMDYPEMIIESHEDDRLLPGRYSLKDSTTLIVIKEEVQPISNIFGVNLFEVRDVLTNVPHIVALANLDKI